MLKTHSDEIRVCVNYHFFSAADSEISYVLLSSAGAAIRIKLRKDMQTLVSVINPGVNLFILPGGLAACAEG